MPLGYISINTQVMLWEFSKYASEMLVHDLLLIFFFFNVWRMFAKEEFVVSLRNYMKEKSVQFPVI